MALGRAAMRAGTLGSAASFIEQGAAKDVKRPTIPSKGLCAMRSILLMLLGVPLPIILLLAFCTHHF